MECKTYFVALTLSLFYSCVCAFPENLISNGNRLNNNLTSQEMNSTLTRQQVNSHLTSEEVNSNLTSQEVNTTLISQVNKTLTTREVILNIRVKRQDSGGAGKYAEAAKVPQVKVLRLLLQMIKNFWDPTYIGGSHPFHRNVPKAIVFLYLDKVQKFFFPPVGGDPKKAVTA